MTVLHPGAEQAILVGLVTVALAMLVAVVLLLMGVGCKKSNLRKIAAFSSIPEGVADQSVRPVVIDKSKR